VNRKRKTELKDQASQLIYFEAAIANESAAVKAVFARLKEIYNTGYNDGMDYAVNNPNKLGAAY
jgi:hypothetical protein